MTRPMPDTTLTSAELDTTVKVWPLLGYAPGDYMCSCALCGETFTGDKRASMCLPCAAGQANVLLARAGRGDEKAGLNPDALLAAYEAYHAHKSDPGRKGDGLAKAISAYLARAGLEAGKAEEWLPIETAPKDGTWVELWRGPTDIGSWEPLIRARWWNFDDDPGWAWPDEPYDPWHDAEHANLLIEDGRCFDTNQGFTHWRPMTQPPAKSKAVADGSTAGADELTICPICAVAFKPDDMCLADIEMGTCHATCLEGSPMVDLETGDLLPEGSPPPSPFPFVEPPEDAIRALPLTTGGDTP